VLQAEMTGSALAEGTEGQEMSAPPEACTVVVATNYAEVASHLEAWEQLETRALDDNLYMTACFVGTALRHDAGSGNYRIVLVYKDNGSGRRLIACAAFSVRAPATNVPMTTLWSFDHRHTYLSHPLLDRDHAALAIRRIWDWVEQRRQPWSLVVLHRMRSDSPVTQLIAGELNRRGRTSWVKETFPRAMLHRHASFDTYLDSLPSSRRKEYRRRWKRLHRAGTVEFSVYRNLRSAPDLAARFMDIERKSWKGSIGTAMALDPKDAAFFTDLTENFAIQDQLFFGELRLNGRPIAISSNFRVGRTLFGFKTAYDPEFKAHSPGIIAEIETVRSFHEDPDLQTGDGGTLGESYLDGYWRDRGEINVLYVATPRLGSRIYLMIIPVLTTIKRKGQALLRGLSRPIEASEADEDR